MTCPKHKRASKDLELLCFVVLEVWPTFLLRWRNLRKLEVLGQTFILPLKLPGTANVGEEMKNKLTCTYMYEQYLMVHSKLTIVDYCCLA